ncbi:Cullin, N-terminal,Cullin, conserved site,Cullin repeat-like-containing domain,Cullin homology,Cullin [Cinara cedri]|uniref:Cullin-2 n=1 Tax=Cinara cedri TaxID=506608 RepID=A0A5E4MQM8_9HEMI|nr:Cullin, N-terminal,Cullin, conserved site,Cullin repeat-like-containing domain,Cullin homology,Cullin [Cinara cedri]
MSLKPKTINFTEKWNSLQETMKGVITLDRVPRDAWNERFNDVYSMCVAFPEPLGDQLYDSTKLFLENHVLELLTIIQTGGTENLLQNYYTYWQKYSKGVKYLHSLYQYLNNQHIKKHRMSEAEILYGNITPDIDVQMEVGELGLDIWKHNMIMPLKDSMLKLLLDEIDKQRHIKSMTKSTDIISTVIKSFVIVQAFRKKNPLELYQVYFEEPLLKQSSEYFKCQAARLLQECTVSEYMVKVLEIMKEESLMSKKIFDDSTYDKLRERCRKHMVGDHLDVLHGESEAMIKEERREDMLHIYLLLRDIKNGMTTLVDIFREHIKQHGIRVIESLKQEQIYLHFVEEVLAVHKKYKCMVIEVFQNDLSFSSALDKAFTVIINYKPVKNLPSKSPEYLSKYCDNLLKKTSKGMFDYEIDRKLLQSITIFKYIDDKDVFQKFYQRHLAKRLIHHQSQSMDGEEGMINKLKQACGYEFTNKLHRMFTDIRVSEGLNAKFHNEFLKTGEELNISFSMYVLQTGAWPLGSSVVSSFVIPKELIPCMQYFEEFYKAKFNGRKLTWLHHHCQGELKLNYLSKPYLVTMQTFQMAIMLLFENRDVYKCTELSELLQLSSDHFQKHFNSLLECKLILMEDDNVTLNMEYANKRTKLRITSALQKDTPQEIEQTVNSIEDDRKTYLQAAIVRIMKARKLLRHNQLVNEILSQSTTFAPTIALIKKSIETLIDKGYLERTPNSADGYSYVA